MHVHIYVFVYVPCCVFGCQRTTYRRFSPTMWVLGLNSSGLMAGTFPHEAILLAQNVDFFRCKNIHLESVGSSSATSGRLKSGFWPAFPLLLQLLSWAPLQQALRWLQALSTGPASCLLPLERALHPVLPTPSIRSVLLGAGDAVVTCWLGCAFVFEELPTQVLCPAAEAPWTHRGGLGREDSGLVWFDFWGKWFSEWGRVCTWSGQDFLG